MNSRSRSVESIIDWCTGWAMKRPGGRNPALIQCKQPASFGNERASSKIDPSPRIRRLWQRTERRNQRSRTSQVHSYFHVVPLCRGHHRSGDEQAWWRAGAVYVGKVSRVPIAPVVFITALDEEASRAEAMSTGCIAYLRKPAPSHLLIGAIEKARWPQGALSR